MTTETSQGRYLHNNNHRLDTSSLEDRLDQILAERNKLPEAVASVAGPVSTASYPRLRRLLIRIKGSRLVVSWLMRYPRIYRLARATYHGVKSIFVRA